MYVLRTRERRRVAPLLTSDEAPTCGPTTGELVFDCGAGRVRVRSYDAGIYCAEYSGVISSACFDTLRGYVMVSAVGARVVLLDMCKTISTHLVAPPVTASAYPGTPAPGVVICRADHYAMWSAYAVKVSELGITRVVLPDSKRALALSVARALSQR